MKGSFRSRPGEESALNPYVTSRNCFENFCIVVCGPFTPRWGIFCFWMSPYLPVCCVCCVHMCCVCATVWLDVEMKWMLRGVYWKKSAPMEPLPKLKRLETLTEIWSTKIWCDAIVVFSWQTSDLPAQSTELERRSSHPPGMCPCKRWRLSFFFFFTLCCCPWLPEDQSVIVSAEVHSERQQLITDWSMSDVVFYFILFLECCCVYRTCTCSHILRRELRASCGRQAALRSWLTSRAIGGQALSN